MLHCISSLWCVLCLCAFQVVRKAGRTYMYDTKSNAVNVSETKSCNMLPFSNDFIYCRSLCSRFSIAPFDTCSIFECQSSLPRSCLLMLFDIRKPGRFVCLALKVSEATHTHTRTRRSSNEFNRQTGFTV